MDLIDKDSVKNNYYPHGFENNFVLRKNISNKKVLTVRTSSMNEDFSNPMKILMLFPEKCYQVKNLTSICESLNVECATMWSAEEAFVALQNSYYDIVLVDRRLYDISNLDVDKLVYQVRTRIPDSTFKIISFSDRVYEDFTKLWEQGYDEQWVNYNDGCALRNYLSGYLRNQFLCTIQMKNTTLFRNIFNKMGSSIVIVNSNFEIENVNQIFENQFKVHHSNIIGTNWFTFHHIPEEKMNFMLKEISTNQKWNGSVTTERVHPFTFQNHMYVSIDSLDTTSNQYIIHINPINLQPSKSDNSITLASFDQDNTLGISRNKDPYLSYSQKSIESPILKVMKIINSIQDITTPTIAHQLQKIIDILTSKDLFITTVNALKTDKMSSSLIDGLLSSNATIFAQTEVRRVTGTYPKRRQTRDNSEIIHDHINKVLAKIGQIKELSENEEKSAVEDLLNGLGNWSFDIFQLERLTEFKPLRHIGMKIFVRFDLATTLKIDGALFQNWLYIIESNYNSLNTYHNSTHAADVLQSSAWFLEREKISEIFDGIDDAISIIAAIIHDLGHPGRTNPFLINSSNNLAVLYNDIAVLENHHVAYGFKVTLKDERINIFKNLNSDDYRVMRHGIIDTVLATEMAKHFEHITKFVNTVMKKKDSLHSNQTESNNFVEIQVNDVLSEHQNRAIIRKMLIKCSDVNNPTRPFDLCEKWAARISEEYFNQTDEEIALNIPVVMPQFNRKTCDIPKSQISFIELFLEDMFFMWHEFADTGELIANLHENKIKWKSMETKDERKEDTLNDEI